MSLALTRGSVAALATAAVALVSFSTPASAATPPATTAATTARTAPAAAVPAVPLTLDGTPVAVTIPADSGARDLTFYGRAGQSVFIMCNEGAGAFGPYGSWQIIAPDGSPVGEQVAGQGFVELALPSDGTYRVRVTPWQGVDSGFTFVGRHVSTVRQGTIALNGTPTTLITSQPGQRAARTFTASAGQRIDVRDLGGDLWDYAWWIAAPDGSRVAGSSQPFDRVTLPVAGTYELVLDPGGSTVGSRQFSLAAAPADVTAGMLRLDGTGKALTTSRVGQWVTTTFTAAAGSRVSFLAAGSGWQGAEWRLVGPDGLAVNTWSQSIFTGPVTLPAAGTYNVQARSTSTRLMSATLRAWLVPADVDGGRLKLGEPPLTVRTTVPGQNATVTFWAVAGQRYVLTTTAEAELPFVMQTSGAMEQWLGGAGRAELHAETTGLVTLTVDPSEQYTGAVSLSLRRLVDVDGGALALDGTVSRAHLWMGGQTARFTFTATQGRYIDLRQIATSNPVESTITITGPDGMPSTVESPYAVTSTGTHTLVVTPTYPSDTGTVALSARLLAENYLGTVPLTGTAVRMRTVSPYQVAVRSFSATAGTVIVGTRTDHTTRWALWSPSGRLVYASLWWLSEPTSPDLTLSETGTYRLVALPDPAVSLLDTRLSLLRRTP